MIHPLLIGLMIGIGDLRCGFGGGELKDRSSEFLEIGDFLCGVGGRGGQAGRGKREGVVDSRSGLTITDFSIEFFSNQLFPLRKA